MFSALRHATLSLLLAVVMIAPASADPRLAEGTTLVENLVERIQTVVAAEPTPEEVRAETNAIIDEFFDYNTIARFAAGQAWRKATDAEKAEYKLAFREVLLSLAETQFEQFRTLEYTSKDAVAKGNKLIVASGMVHDITGKYPDSVVSWRISTRPGKPIKIIDIEVENISMLITQQQENTAIIRQNGGKFQALIDALKEQAQSIKTAE
ncbi:MAG: ABC transporter substrate-binding protein [Alphaproteobacteria bacterium]|nr:ABC transporter substrate-binding protein [Alphaproteobacteria bacterium]